MKLSDYFNERGQQARLAQALRIPAPSLSAWATGAREVPSEHCPAIERATNGAVCCEDLRHDVTWQRISDPNWPHPDGRPCIDVAAPSGSQAQPHAKAA